MLRIELSESILSGAKELLETFQVDIAVSPLTIKDIFSEELCQIEFMARCLPHSSTVCHRTRFNY